MNKKEFLKWDVGIFDLEGLKSRILDIKKSISTVIFPTSKTSTSGFTLVEIMIVISILAILSAIGVVFYSQAELTARDSKRMEDIKEIQKALEQRFFLTRGFPHDIYSTTTSEAAGNGGLPAIFQTGSIPRDPKRMTSGVEDPYRYFVCPSTGVGSRYIVCAQLEICDGKCNRASVAGIDPCDDPASDGTNPTGADHFYCAESLQQ